MSGVLAAGGILDRIVAARARRLSASKRERPLAQIIEALESSAPSLKPRSMRAALEARGRTKVIAEIKQRSPSRGIIREELDPLAIAGDYERGGAAALSILTEEDFFGGSLERLRAIGQRSELPLLRKDFIFDEYQVYESCEAGADALLLIVALLDDELLKKLIECADEAGIDALVEVHTEAEMERASRAGARIVGVNNRDLTTFKVDMETSLKLAERAPDGALLVSESGIKTGADVRRLKAAGFSAFLIGEHLMRAESPGQALKALIEESQVI
jgi:indole-3-glycerol phosphate synthase